MTTVVATRPHTARPPGTPRTVVVLARHLLWSSRRSVLTWGGSIGAMSALIAAVWPSIEGSVSDLVREYPPALKTAFGIDALDSLAAYVQAEMLSLIVPLAVVFLAVRCVVGATAAAEERKHLDVLLTLPIGRRPLIAAACIAAGALCAVVLVISAAMTCVAGALAGASVDVGAIARGFANVWPLAMGFAGVAAVAVGITSRAAAATAAAVGLAVAMYVVDLVGKLADGLEPVRVVSAFRLYGNAVRDGLDAGHIALLLLAAIALTAAGAVLFDRRDLR